MDRTVLLVGDEDPQICGALRERLELEGYGVRQSSARRALPSARQDRVDLVLVGEPPLDGDAELVRQLKLAQPSAPVIVLAEGGTPPIATVVTAMRAGAHDVVVRRPDLDAVVATVRRAKGDGGGQRQVYGARHDGPARIVGESAEMRQVKQVLERVARGPASTVLLTGETGTGKDLAARWLHDGSPRRDGPLINITCSALPPSLLESELFGYERGAFTDAKDRKAGLFEHAHGGTLFLDEIGDLERPVQSRLLRFLEDRGFRRVGGIELLHADVRVVAATNVDLAQAVREGNFREDLYYRLAVMPIHLPPLRARPGDISLLAGFFIAEFNQAFGCSVCGLTPRGLQRLEGHSWPGNIRELRNTIERAMLLSPRELLDVDDLPLVERARDAVTRIELPAEGIDLRALERALVVQALKRCGGNQVRAAALLRLSRDQIRYRIEKFSLRGIGREEDAQR